ncbi:MAG: hypothetical protein ACOH1J_01230 [Microbacteriaceae bacterium]
MDTTLQAPVIVAIAGLVVWLVVVAVQLSAIIAAVLDVRGARDTRSPGRQARAHKAELIVTIPIVASFSILLLFGIDVAAKFAFDWSKPLEAVLLLLALIATALIGGSLVVLAVARGEVVDYPSLRADLMQREGERLSPHQFSQFTALFSEADDRQRRLRLGPRNGATLPEIRAELAGLSDQFGVNRPRGLDAIRAISWRAAHTVLWRASPWQVVAVAIAAVPAVAAIGSLALGNSWEVWPVLPILILLPIASFVVALVGVRTSLASKVAWHAIAQNQRAEVVDLLAEFERTSRKGVAGLGDRVTRALQILRDQQQ